MIFLTESNFLKEDTNIYFKQIIFFEKKRFCKNHTYFFLKNIFYFSLVLLHLNNHSSLHQFVVVYSFREIESTFPVSFWEIVTCCWWLRGVIFVCLIRSRICVFLFLAIQQKIAISLRVYNDTKYMFVNTGERCFNIFFW